MLGILPVCIRDVAKSGVTESRKSRQGERVKGNLKNNLDPGDARKILSSRKMLGM